jgi:hypothetical protein
MQYTMISGYAAAPTAHAAEVSTGIVDAVPFFRRIHDVAPTAHAAEVSTGIADAVRFPRRVVGAGGVAEVSTSLQWGVGRGIASSSFQWGIGRGISG